METKRLKELTKLMLPLVEGGGHLPESACFIQTDKHLYTYNSKISTMALCGDGKEFVVCAPSFAKFLAPKSVVETEIDVADGEVTFSTDGKEMTLANVPFTGASVTVKRVLDDAYEEMKNIPFVEVPEKIQKTFIKLLKQAYLQNKVSYDLAGVYLSEVGIFSTDAMHFSFIEMPLPIKDVLHIGAAVMDYLVKIKEPIIKIGYKEDTHSVYFCGESGIIYLCHTTQLAEEHITSHKNNVQQIRNMSSTPAFRVTEEMYEALTQASVAEGQGNAGVIIALDGKTGEVRNCSRTASYKGEFSWDENEEWVFTIMVDYNTLMKYVKVGTALHPIESQLNYLSIENERHTVFIPDITPQGSLEV